ncbi:MAG: hydroxyethylthiazole kinase [Deltaproteobacteria bacterium]|nr:MAG: hydroxyethylthiazole kinase [Deltaproteobacteria bacterium]
MSQIVRQSAENLQKIRASKPLVHNITNYVVMNFTANALLAAGASPVMAHAINEVEDMAGIANALVLNIGTLSDDWVEAMVLAGQKASSLKTPVVLDPVGAGATALRTDAAKRILQEVAVRIVRGNSSEILALSGGSSATRGVDAANAVDEAAGVAVEMARELKTTLAITGKIDLVTDGERVIEVANGHEMMPYITGTGCTATALVGAFAAVEEDMPVAAAGALAFIGLAGERAARAASGPGSFAVHFLDALYRLSTEEFVQSAKIVVR